MAIACKHARSWFCRKLCRYKHAIAHWNLPGRPNAVSPNGLDSRGKRSADAPSICACAHFCVVEAHLVLLLRSDELCGDGEESKVRAQPCQRGEVESAVAQFVEGFYLGVKVGSVDNSMLQCEWVSWVRYILIVTEGQAHMKAVDV